MIRLRGSRNKSLYAECQMKVLRENITAKKETDIPTQFVSTELITTLIRKERLDFGSQVPKVAGYKGK